MPTTRMCIDDDRICIRDQQTYLHLRVNGGVTAATRESLALGAKLNCAAADQSDATRVVDRRAIAQRKLNAMCAGTG